MVLKLNVTERVRYAFNRIRLPVRKIVGRIDTPLVAVAMVMRPKDTIHYRVTHV